MFEENTQKTNAEQSLSQEELNIFKEFSWELDFWPEKVSLNKEEVKTTIDKSTSKPANLFFEELDLPV